MGTGITDVIGGPHDFLPPRSDRSDEFQNSGIFDLDKNNESPDWMTDLNTLTPHGKKMHVKEIYVIFIHLFDSGILLIIVLAREKGEG
jgi:hypothetical protein